MGFKLAGYYYSIGTSISSTKQYYYHLHLVTHLKIEIKVEILGAC